MSKRTILILFLFVAAVAAYFGIRAYSAKVPQAADVTAETTVGAESLFNDFATDETKAGVRYNDKVIEVVGAVKDVSVSADGRMSIHLESGDPMGGVVCDFSEKAAPPAIGDTVAIKGFCAGYNFDVLIQRCAFSLAH